jgi:hypothetical protein
MYLFLLHLINPIHIQNIRVMVSIPSQHLRVCVCKQITLLITYYIYLLKISDTTIIVSDIFNLTVSLKFVNFSLGLFHLFASEMSTNFTSYTL